MGPGVGSSPTVLSVAMVYWSARDTVNVQVRVQLSLVTPTEESNLIGSVVDEAKLDSLSAASPASRQRKAEQLNSPSGAR